MSKGLVHAWRFATTSEEQLRGPIPESEYLYEALARHGMGIQNLLGMDRILKEIDGMKTLTDGQVERLKHALALIGEVWEEINQSE